MLMIMILILFSFVCFLISLIFSATNNHSLFVINVSTGVISLNGTLDREDVSEYKLRVLVGNHSWSLQPSVGWSLAIRNKWPNRALVEFIVYTPHSWTFAPLTFTYPFPNSLFGWYYKDIHFGLVTVRNTSIPKIFLSEKDGKIVYDDLLRKGKQWTCSGYS